MLMGWPRQSTAETRPLRFIPENMTAWQLAHVNWSASSGLWSGYGLHVPSCAHMELFFLRNVHLRLANSNVPPVKRIAFAPWATVSIRELNQAGLLCLLSSACNHILPEREHSVPRSFRLYLYP